MLTPKGKSVFSRVLRISSASISGGMFPPARTPNPPAFEIAETRFDSDTQVIAPHRLAYRVPRKSVPFFHAFGRYFNTIRTLPRPFRENNELYHGGEELGHEKGG